LTIAYIGTNTSITREQALAELYSASEISIDIETVSLKERCPLGLSISWSPTDSLWFSTYPDFFNPDIPWNLLDSPIPKIFHNAIFDLKCFPEGHTINTDIICDTNILAHLLNYKETSLEMLGGEVNREVTTARTLMDRHSGKDMLCIPQDELAKKCCNDSQVTLMLWRKWKDKIWDKSYWDIEMKVIPILVEMSLRGLKVDQAMRAELEEKTSKEIEFYQRQTEMYGFQVGSNQQEGYILAKRGNFLPFTRGKDRKTTRKQLSVSVETLERIDDPVAALILNHRHYKKASSTYILPLRDREMMYTDYNLEAIVGRISSSNMNVQNIPDWLRCMFIPQNGCFTTGDFSQEHLRILAHWSQDREMLRVYDEGYLDGDIHQFLANQAHISRKLAKTLNYNIIYSLFTNAAIQSVSDTSKIRDKRRVSELIDKWVSTFPGAAEWIRGAQDYGVRVGYAMPTLFGRVIKLPDIIEEGEDAVRRKACNYPIIGSDGEIMKRALIICKEQNPDMALAATVHDSITVDGDITFPIDKLENIAPFRIPFETKQTYHWE
jgi:DNA polymerase I-like protein with 3'-5' exonuclease and polymerase domains